MTMRIQWSMLAVVVLGVAFTCSARAQEVKAFRALNFGDSVTTICAKITRDPAFTTDSTQACGSTQTEITLYGGPPYGTFRPNGLTSLRPFYTVRLLGVPSSANLDFVDDQLYGIGLRTWPNLKDSLSAHSLFLKYVAVLDHALGTTPAHTTNPDSSTTVRETYAWSLADKLAVVHLNTYEDSYWIDIQVTNRALGTLASQRIKSAAKQVAANDLRQQQDKAKQQEQELQNAAKDF